RLLERDHELAALDRDALSIAADDAKARDQGLGRALLLLVLEGRARLVLDERRLRELQAAGQAERHRGDVGRTLAVGDLELQLRMPAGQAGGGSADRWLERAVGELDRRRNGLGSGAALRRERAADAGRSAVGRERLAAARPGYVQRQGGQRHVRDV